MWVFISQEGGKCKLFPLNLLKTHTHTRNKETEGFINTGVLC